MAFVGGLRMHECFKDDLCIWKRRWNCIMGGGTLSLWSKRRKWIALGGLTFGYTLLFVWIAWRPTDKLGLELIGVGCLLWGAMALLFIFGVRLLERMEE
jgi:hypothetical protein